MNSLEIDLTDIQALTRAIAGGKSDPLFFILENLHAVARIHVFYPWESDAKTFSTLSPSFEGRIMTLTDCLALSKKQWGELHDRSTYNGHLVVFYESRHEWFLDAIFHKTVNGAELCDFDVATDPSQMQLITALVDQLPPEHYLIGFMHDGSPMVVLGAKDFLVRELRAQQTIAHRVREKCLLVLGYK